MRLSSEQESIDRERERVRSRGKKSRTSSREQVKQQDSLDSQTDRQSEASSYSYLESSETEALKTMKSRTQSREGPRPTSMFDDLAEDRMGAKSRTRSRERPRDLTQELYPEEKREFEEEQLRSIPRGAKSRTGSNERHPGSVQRPGSGLRQAPMWPEEEDSQLQQRPRSRTSSADRRRLVGGGRDDLLAEDPGFDSLPSGPTPSGFRTYRDEMEQDIRQYTLDAGAVDTFNPEDDDDEPPPAEPIYNPGAMAMQGRMQNQNQFAMAQDNFEHVPMDETSAFESDYRYDDASAYASELDHEVDTSSRISKKVSFAESDQKFHLKPDPEVRGLPGTKLFTFAPSATHEQPPGSGQEAAAGFPQGPIPRPVPVSESAAGRSEQETEESHYSTAPSTSPKAFLKAMTKGLKPREEREGSLLGNVFKRGRSSSNQGSRSSSRQGSLDREGRRPGGSNQSDYSTGSLEFEVSTNEIAL